MPGPRDLLEILAIAVILAVFARGFVVQAFKIPSASMEQNLLVGDHILVNKFVYGPASGLERALLPVREVRRGDVVVFKFPEDPRRDFIKRCVGLPGDRIQLIDKRLVINERLIDEESYLHLPDRTTFPSGLASGPHSTRDNFGPFEVPADHFFCLGDNRDNSNDSRFWGPVPAAYVKGRAVVIYWSVPPLDLPSDLGNAEKMWAALRYAGGLGGQTRWERSFRVVH